MYPDLSFLYTPEFQAYLAQLGLGGAYPGAQQGPPTYTPSGTMYTGPFGNDNRTPFRTVAPVQEGGFQPAYNRGLNASSAQLYDHFRSKPGKTAHDYGFAYAGPTQTFENFANRPVLEVPEVPEVPTEIPGPNPNTNTSGAFQGGGMLPSIFRFQR